MKWGEGSGYESRNADSGLTGVTIGLGGFFNNPIWTRWVFRLIPCTSASSLEAGFTQGGCKRLLWA